MHHFNQDFPSLCRTVHLPQECDAGTADAIPGQSMGIPTEAELAYGEPVKEIVKRAALGRGLPGQSPARRRKRTLPQIDREAALEAGVAQLGTNRVGEAHGDDGAGR